MLFNKIEYRSPHMHREFELVYNFGCEAIYNSSSVSVLLPSGSFAIFNPNQAHEIIAQDSNPFMVCLQIAPEFFENINVELSYLEFDAFYLEDYVNARMRELVTRLSYSYLKQEDNYSFECASLIYQIFKELLDVFPHHITTPSEKKSNEEKALRLKRILKYAKNHYMEKISLQELAKEENLSLTYLSRFVKENLNRSFQEYIGELRYNQAKYLVTYSNKNLMDICQECGYSDYRYFYEAFMEHCKCSPKQYRSQHFQLEAETTSASIETKLSRWEAMAMINELS
jgi:AraC-like DNA-binding protein